VENRLTIVADKRGAAPLPHLSHLTAEQRRVTAEIGGTPRGYALANHAEQWARQEHARADAVEAQAQMIAQTRGTGHPMYGEAIALAEKYRQRAQAFEAEAVALKTSHSVQVQEPTSDGAYERYRNRIQDSWKS
jgi:hypothetical protein